MKRKSVKELLAKIRILEQEVQALGSVNRYYFREKNGRDAVDDNELIMYYIENGGATFYGISNPHLDPTKDFCWSEDETDKEHS